LHNLTGRQQGVRGRSFPVILAGNCNASVGVAAGLADQDLGLVWFDAHADLDTPDKTTSGYFDGMEVSILAEKSWRAFLQTIPGFSPLGLDRVVYCGVKDLSGPQRARLRDSPARVVYGNKDRGVVVDFAEELDTAIHNAQLRSVVVHLDVDCLDTTLGRANEYAAPGGLREDDLSRCMEVISRNTRPVALTVASYNPHLGEGDAIWKLVSSLHPSSFC
jgi:arginase